MTDNETAEENRSVIGRSVLREDSRTKVTGREKFVTDLNFPGTLVCTVLGSPYAHAKIVSIDTSQAEKLPGVIAVITDEDTPRMLHGTGAIKDVPVLARGVARYIGDPIAAVAAKTREIGQQAIRLIEVEYEELPAIFDVEESASENPSVVIHPDRDNYFNKIDAARQCPERPNVFCQERAIKGDVEKGFEEADVIVENRFTSPSIQHIPMEPHATLIKPEADGGITIYAGKHALWSTKGDITRMFGIPYHKVRVVQQYVGGSFGGKVIPIEYIPTALALKAKRPVKWVMSREESMVIGGPREGATIYVKDGWKKDGTIVARKVTVYLDGGAYAEQVGIVAQRSASASVSMYRIPHLSYHCLGVYTNTPKRGGMRGFGANEVHFAIEGNINIAARTLNIDPLKLRMKSVLQEGERQLNGEVMHSIGLEDCGRAVSDELNTTECPAPDGPWRYGRAISFGNKFSTVPTICGARVHLTDQCRLEVAHGADAVGQGVNTAMAQIAASEFGIEPDKIDIIFSDTARTPLFGNGSTSSRTTFTLGNAVISACNDLKKRVFELAAPKLNANPDDLDTAHMAVFVRSDPERRMEIADLFVQYMGRPLHLYGGTPLEGREMIGTGSYEGKILPDNPETGQLDPGKAAAGGRNKGFFTYTAKAVEVKVNTETGEVFVTKCYNAVDLGRAINPKICEQQIEGGSVMGIGTALYEETQFKDGRVMNPNLTDYRIPLAFQLPSNAEMKSILIETAPHKEGPYGAKGYAEAVAIGTESAIVDAVEDAVGVRITDLPISGEKVLKALRELQTKEAATEAA